METRQDSTPFRIITVPGWTYRPIPPLPPGIAGATGYGGSAAARQSVLLQRLD
jgi:hypothetical protein